MPGTKLFDRFEQIEQFYVTTGVGDLEVKCRLQNELLDKFKLACDDAVPEPNAEKWAVRGKVNFHADGKDYEALILWISDDEAGLRFSIKDYWRGIRRKDINEVVLKCVKENIGGLSK